MIASAVLLVRVPQPPQAGSGAAEVYPQTAQSPAKAIAAPGGAVRTIHRLKGVGSYVHQSIHEAEAHHDVAARRAAADPCPRRQEGGGQMNALASPARTCTSWCLGTHPEADPCFSGYDTTALSLHPLVAVITPDGVGRVSDEVSVSVEQTPGQDPHVVVFHGEASVELTVREALAHALQVASRALAALQAEVTP